MRRKREKIKIENVRRARGIREMKKKIRISKRMPISNSALHVNQKKSQINIILIKKIN